MLQQVMTAPGVIEFREIPTPEAGPGQVLAVRIFTFITGSIPLQNIPSPKDMKFLGRLPLWVLESPGLFSARK